MPVTQWIHPVTRDRVDLDHFDRDTAGLKGRSAWPPWAARCVAASIKGDKRHTGTITTTATRCLGCPRETFIQAAFDYAVNPATRFLMDRGTMLHGVAAEHSPPNYLTEHGEGREQLTLSGELFGTKVSALLDGVRRDDGPVTEIFDHKFPMDWSVRYRGKKFPDERQQYVTAVGKCSESWAKFDHAMQLNIARLLLAQQPWAVDAGYDPDNVLLTIWDYGIGKNAYPIALEAPHIDEAKMFKARPGGGKFAVEEIVFILGAVQDEWNAIPEAERTEERREEMAAQIPLVGQEGMFGGQKCGSYCDVEGICSRIVRERGMPKWENEG